MRKSTEVVINLFDVKGYEVYAYNNKFKDRYERCLIVLNDNSTLIARMSFKRFDQVFVSFLKDRGLYIESPEDIDEYRQKMVDHSSIRGIARSFDEPNPN